MIQLHRISPNDIISDAPQFFNDIFSLLEQHINALENVVDRDTKVINLAGSNIPVPAGSLIANNIVLLGKSETVFAISNSVEELLSLSSTGSLKCKQIIANGTDESVIDNLATDNLTVKKKLTAAGGLTIASKSTTAKKLTLEATSIGALATTPIQINDCSLILLDYRNLSETHNAVKIDTTGIAENQSFRLQLLCNPTTGKAELYNGDTFAVIDPTAVGGFKALGTAISPEFTYDNAPGKRISYLDVQWMDIGGGSFKLVILDSQNVTY